MKRHLIHIGTAHQRNRRGSIFPIFVVALLLLTLVTGSLIKSTHLQQKRVTASQFSTQAHWLATSGLERGRAALEQSADYTGEEWKISAADLGGSHAGLVVLNVEPIPSETKKVKLTAVARYPTKTELRAQVTRRQVVDLK
jgi:type II secretory pathway component PulK